MAVFRARTARELLQRMIDFVVSRSKLNDLTDGSNLKQILAAVARQLQRLYREIALLLTLYSIWRAKGDDLDARASEYMPDGFERTPATKAVGTLRWSRATATATAIPIPAGTVVAKKNTTVAYVTTAPGEIAGGGTQSARTDGPGGDIPARAQIAGSSGNASIDTVTKQVSVIAGTNAVTNPTPFTGGNDREDDDAFRRRIVERTRSLARCTREAIETRARETDLDGQRVVVARAFYDPFNPGHSTLYIDDGSGNAETFSTTAADEYFTEDATGGESRFHFVHRPLRQDAWTITREPLVGPAVLLTANVDYKVVAPWGWLVLSEASFPAGLTAGDKLRVAPYEYYTGLVAEAQLMIDGSDLDPDLPSYHAEGAVIRVRTPSVRWVEVAATVVVLDGFSRETVLAQVREDLANYVNSLGIGDDVIWTELVERAMGVDGMYDVVVTLDGGTTNIPVGDSQVARLHSSNLQVS